MLVTHSAVWRIEFRTDATRADAPVIPLGVLRESCVADDGRFLGLIFRPKLTPLECDKMNFATWPELSEDRLESFMNSLFEKAWAHSCEAADGKLGADRIAKQFSQHSALAFVSADARECKAANWQRLQLNLHESLFDHEDWLAPTLNAPIMPFQRKPVVQPAYAPMSPEIVLKAA
jgi:hypothetical protein